MIPFLYHRRRVAMLLAIPLALVGCYVQPDPKEVHAAQMVTVALRDAGNMPEMEQILSFDTGPLDEGIAVVLTQSREAAGGADWRYRDYAAAFWFKDDVVYAVNEEALEMVPGLERAPEQITLECVIEIAK